MQVNDHISAGMKTVYEVTEGPDSMAALAKLGDAQPKGVTRDYYVAAEKVLWDYAPLGGDACSGSLQPFSEAGAVRAANNATEGQIGSRRFRAMYVEYTDTSFAVKKVSVVILSLLLRSRGTDCPADARAGLTSLLAWSGGSSYGRFWTCNVQSPNSILVSAAAMR